MSWGVAPASGRPFGSEAFSCCPRWRQDGGRSSSSRTSGERRVSCDFFFLLSIDSREEERMEKREKRVSLGGDKSAGKGKRECK